METRSESNLQLSKLRSSSSHSFSFSHFLSWLLPGSSCRGFQLLQKKSQLRSSAHCSSASSNSPGWSCRAVVNTHKLKMQQVVTVTSSAHCSSSSLAAVSSCGHETKGNTRKQGRVAWIRSVLLPFVIHLLRFILVLFRQHIRKFEELTHLCWSLAPLCPSSGAHSSRRYMSHIEIYAWNWASSSSSHSSSSRHSCMICRIEQPQPSANPYMRSLCLNPRFQESHRKPPKLLPWYPELLNLLFNPT